MAQVYEVQYQINVNNGPALEAIKQFQQATVQLERMSRRFDEVARKIGKVNSAFKALQSKPINITVNTASAEQGLKRVMSLMTQMQTQAKTALAAPNVGNIAAAMKQVKTLSSSINKTTITPKANTQKAVQSLDLLLNKLNQIKANSKITIAASAAGASSAAAGATGAKGRTVVAPVRRPAPTAGRSSYLYPTTRQVLGPTYAQTGTNVAGEMIKGMGIAYGLSALMSGVGNVFRSATAYENVSQTTKNILGAHDKSATFEGDFNSMNKLMRQVGMETKFTAPQVASAGKFLAMAGYRTNDIQQSIRPISNLALIGDSDLGETADVVTNIMTGYEIPAQQMNKVADILTMTFTKSNTTLMELAESFKYAGTVARQSGLEFEQTAAAIGVLGDAGIKASHAGTTLRMMLMNMQAPTKKQRAAWQALGISPKDAAGNLKDFNSLMMELNKKSKEMSSGDFTSLFYQAFRVTAATGAMALVRHADKLQEVTNLNQTSSYGLSTELANAKKNTIEGLWYQMTSAFTESGMKGFEAMQAAIRSFLQRMIQLMKSPEFVEALSSAMQMFLKLAETITSVFKLIMSVWNMLPNWAKDGFVYFVKIQMILGIIAGIMQSIMSTWMMIRGIMAGEWLSKLFLRPIISSVVYMAQLYNIQRKILGLSRAQAIWGMLSGTGTHVGRSINRMFMGSVGGTAIGTTVAAGATKATSTLASFAGSSLWSGIGQLGKLFLTHPVGWSLMALTAIGGIGYAVYNTYQKTQEAIKANKEWGESYKKLGIDSMELSDSSSLIIGNMRIFNNELLTHNQRVAQSTELWNRYWDAQNNHSPKIADTTKFIDTEGEAAANFKKQLDMADSFWGVNKAFIPLLETLGGSIRPYSWINRNGDKVTGNQLFLNGRYIPLGRSTSIGETAAVSLALAQLGADPNNEKRKQLEGYLLRQVSGAHNYQDYLNIMAAARKRYMPNKYLVKWNSISDETAREMSWGDIQMSQDYVRALRINMQGVFDAWSNFGKLLKSYDENGAVDYRKVQSVLHSMFGNLFDTQYGLFGSQGYMKYLKDIVNHPQKYGYENVAEATGRINQSFDQLLNWYDTLDNHYKPLFAAFLNRSPLEQSLPDGHFTTEGGYQAPTKAGQKMTVDGKTYIATLFAGTGRYEWLDEKGQLYTPKSSKETQTWSPTSGGGSSNPASSLHNGADQSQYKSHYSQSAAPKQVIVKIENLMRVDKQTIDMTDSRQVAAINNIKQELATALLDVVQDFNANII